MEGKKHTRRDGGEARWSMYLPPGSGASVARDIEGAGPGRVARDLQPSVVQLQREVLAEDHRPSRPG